MVTIFKKYSDIGNPITIDIQRVLNSIKNGKVKEQIEKIRQESDQDVITQLKKELPCVLFAGEFTIPIKKTREDGTIYESYRNDNSLSIHSKFIPFDVDDIDDVEKFKIDAQKDPFIYALWTSPSGTGLHGLIKIADGNKHEEHYNAILKRYPIFDPTARNPSRILFLSYDPNIYINHDSKTFFEVIENVRNEGILMTGVTTDYSKLNIASKMIQKAEIGQRHHSVIKASYLAGGWVSGGLVEQDVAKMVLEHEVLKKFGADEYEIEIQAVSDGLKAGQYMPINELATYERSAIEELGMIEDELSFLVSNKVDEEYMRRYRAGLIPMGLPFGYEDMDKHLLLKEGEFYALLSHAHTGKTALTFWLIFLSSYKYDWGWVVYTGENKTASVKMRMIEHYVGKSIKDCSEFEFQEALKWVNERMYFINNDTMYSYDDILRYAEKVSKFHSIKGLFIDPINALKVKGNNKYDSDMEMYTDMLLFTKRTNISIFVALHTRSQSQRERDKDGNQLIPFPADADGGAVLYNKADIFLTMNRNIQDPNTWMITEIYVNKMRNKDTGGNTTPRGQTIKLKMDKGIEFTDENGWLPIKRVGRVEPKVKYVPPTDEELEKIMKELPF
jgi:hypothetical protein